MKDFVGWITNQLDEQKQLNEKLQAEMKRFRSIELVLQIRSARLKLSFQNAAIMATRSIDNRSVILRVVEKGKVQYAFKLLLMTKLGKVIEIIQNKRQDSFLLACDGPLKYGGTAVKRTDTLFELGMAQVSNTVQGATLFMEDTRNS
jgi:hypothetical protein